MKRIALFMDGWKRNFTFAWPAGIMQRIKETQEEVNLYIFHSSGNWSRDESYNEGEYNIYHLPNLSDFDGVVLDLCNVEQKSVSENLIEKVRASGLPTVAIGQRIPGFIYAGIDN